MYAYIILRRQNGDRSRIPDHLGIQIYIGTPAFGNGGGHFFARQFFNGYAESGGDCGHTIIRRIAFCGFPPSDHAISKTQRTLQRGQRSAALFAQRTNIFDRKRHRKIPPKIDDSLLTIRSTAIIIRITEGAKSKSPLNVRRLGIVSNVGGSSISDYSLTVVKPKHEGRRIFLFYENVKRLCEKKGTNFCAVEKACGIGNGVLGKFSDGDRDPSVKTLKKLSKYFNVPMDKLLK